MVEYKPLGLDFYPDSGGMAEWTKAAVLKTAVGLTAHRGFESLSLRLGLRLVYPDIYVTVNFG